MGVCLGYCSGRSIDPFMWFVIVICTWFIKNNTFISTIISIIIFVGGWMIIFRVFVWERPPNQIALIMSIFTTAFWGIVVGFFWNRKRAK